MKNAVQLNADERGQLVPAAQRLLATEKEFTQNAPTTNDEAQTGEIWRKTAAKK